MFELTLREASRIPIDLTGILPDSFPSFNERDVARTLIMFGNSRIPLGEFFAVRLKSDRCPWIKLAIEGDCSNVKNIGVGMTIGVISVHGPVGPHLGAQMKNGHITVESAGDWAGAEMSGGTIIVKTNCGSLAGAAYRGSRRGMTGGRITIGGDAGEEVGLLMRRGRISIGGNCGAFAGASMIAGTILVDGSFGESPGTGMKRGTLISRQQIQNLSPGFRYSCDYEPAYLRVLNERLRWMSESKENYIPMNRVRCYRGDILTGGRGEIWQVIT